MRALAARRWERMRFSSAVRSAGSSARARSGRSVGVLDLHSRKRKRRYCCWSATRSRRRPRRISLGRAALVRVGIVETLPLLELAPQVRPLGLLHIHRPSRTLGRVREPAPHLGGLVVGFLRNRCVSGDARTLRAARRTPSARRCLRPERAARGAAPRRGPSRPVERPGGLPPGARLSQLGRPLRNQLTGGDRRGTPGREGVAGAGARAAIAPAGHPDRSTRDLP